jgi:hypothetical protein
MSEILGGEDSPRAADSGGLGVRRTGCAGTRASRGVRAAWTHAGSAEVRHDIALINIGRRTEARSKLSCSARSDDRVTQEGL